MFLRDSFGTRFVRVFSICKKEKINYKYGNNEFGFYFDFIRTSIDNINVTRNVTIKLSSVERDVLSLIDSKKGIKRSELAQELDKTEMTIHRADSTKEHMGLTTWKRAPEGRIHSTDVVIAKNYLDEEEVTHYHHLLYKRVSLLVYLLQ